MSELEIYDRNRAYTYAKRFMERQEITQKQKEKILEFDDYLETEENLSILRRAKYLRLLSKNAVFLGVEFDQAEKKDIIRAVKAINNHPSWADSTKRDYKVFLKRFYKWLEGDDEEYPKKVKWIKTGGKDTSPVKPSDLLSKQEAEKILSVAMSARDKAFIHVLAESGARIGEIGTLQRKDVSFDTYGAVIHVSGKTGERPIRLVQSASDLHFWYTHHPEKDKTAPLWPSQDNPKDCLCYAALVKILKKHFKLAGIKKKYNPHMFRHYRLTELSKHLSDQELKVYAGWSKNSRMIETYSHITGGEVANKIVEINGLKKEEQETSQSNVSPCPRCSSPNSITDDFCYNCHLPLNDTAMQEVDSIQKETLQKIQGNPEAKELLSQLLNLIKENRV